MEVTTITILALAAPHAFVRTTHLPPSVRRSIYRLGKLSERKYDGCPHVEPVLLGHQDDDVQLVKGLFLFYFYEPTCTTTHPGCNS